MRANPDPPPAAKHYSEIPKQPARKNKWRLQAVQMTMHAGHIARQHVPSSV
jgi:hypothetical protein